MTMQKVSPSSSPVDVSDITTKMNIWPANMGILTDSVHVLQKPIMSGKFSNNFFILRGHTLSVTAIFWPFLTPSPPLAAE